MRILCLLLLGLVLLAPACAQEVCNNAIDDDADGLIDLNDTTDCTCNTILGGGGVESIIPNPSFEEMDCCPQSFSELNCAMEWEQATSGTSDFLHTCGFFPSGVPTPLPDGDGCLAALVLVGWQEYVGVCLDAPMTAGTSYTLSMMVA